MQLCTIRYLGFFPDIIKSAPLSIIEFLSSQLKIPLEDEYLYLYGSREQTKTDHLLEVLNILGFEKPNSDYLNEMSLFLLNRAMEHDKPVLLFQMASEKFYKDKILRPGISTIEDMVTRARIEAQEQTVKRIEPLLTRERKNYLDNLLKVNSTIGRTPLSWSKNSWLKEQRESLRSFNRLKDLVVFPEYIYPASKIIPLGKGFVVIRRKSYGSKCEGTTEGDYFNNDLKLIGKVNFPCFRRILTISNLPIEACSYQDGFLYVISEKGEDYVVQKWRVSE